MSILALPHPLPTSCHGRGTPCRYPGKLFARIAFSLTTGSGKLISICTQNARRFAFWLRSLHCDANVAAQEPEQLIHNVVLDGLLELLKHAECFVLELNQRIALRN